MDAILAHISTTAPSTTVPNYGNIHGRGTWNGVEVQVAVPAPHTFVLSKVRVDLRNTLGGGAKGVRVELRVNGTTLTGGAGPSITITGSAISGTDLAHPVTINQGDKVCWVITPISAPVYTNFGISICAIQTASGKYAEFFHNLVGTVTATTFYAPTGGNANSTEASAFAPLPFMATLKNLYVCSSVDPTPGNWVFLLRSAGANTALTVTMAAGTTAGTVLSDDFATTGHSYATSVVGEAMAIRATGAASPATSVLMGSYTVEPATDGDFAIWGSHGTAASTTSGEGNAFGSTTGGWSVAAGTAEIGNVQVALWACTLKDIYLKTNSAPGAGNTYTCTVRDKPGSGGTIADTAMTGTVTGATTTGNATGFSVAVADGDYIDASVAASSAFTARNFHIAIRASIFSGPTNFPKNIGAVAVASANIVRSIAQILKPFSIISGTWVKQDGSPGNVSVINEATANDATYLSSPYHPVTSVERIQLDAGNAPLPGNPILRIRYQKDVTPGIEGIDLTVKLYMGATLITTRTYTGIGAITEDDYTLTPTETALITDWSALQLEFTANHQ